MMSLIRADGVNFSYFGSTEPVFTNLNFTADTSWRTGLIGANGSGKTTLFKILCGEEKCGGKIVSNVRFVRFPFDADPYESVSDIAARCGETWRLARELSLLGLDKEVRCRPLGTLSGGERTKVMLAVLFCTDGFPLIDEPTDSLDMRGRERLAEYLKGKQGYIVASHDRVFLDRCTDHTLALTESGAEGPSYSRSAREKTQPGKRGEKNDGGGAEDGALGGPRRTGKIRRAKERTEGG